MTKDEATSADLEQKNYFAATEATATTEAADARTSGHGATDK
jgi:hypothetical protein